MFMKLLVLLREKAMVLEDERDQKECMTLWVVVVGEGARLYKSREIATSVHYLKMNSFCLCCVLCIHHTLLDHLLGVFYINI